MLYDVLPPIFLFSSLGGIIITISRVLLRVRRQQFSENITPQPEDVTVNEDQIFKPEKKGISIFKNRLAVIPHAIRQTTAQTTDFFKNKKTALKERRQLQPQAEPSPDDYPAVDVPAHMASDATASSEQNITMPRSAWREKFSAVSKVKGLGASLLSKAQKTRASRASSLPSDYDISPDGTESVTVANTSDDGAEQSRKRPRISLRRATAASSEVADKTSSVMSRLRKSPARSAGKSILEQASDAIASAKYHQAEDILLPYIIKHARDAKAYMLLGQTALGQKDWSEAIEIFQQVLKLNPAEPGAHAALGYAALKAGRFTLALQTLQRAHEQDPQDLEVLKQLLRIAQRMDNSVLKRSISEKITALHASGQYH